MPPLASRNSPARAPRASVNAPLTWPNSSLSRSGSGIAAQLTATSGPAARLLWRCSARATSSLPVPLSPVTSTLASVGATRAISSWTSRIAALSPSSSPSRAVATCRRSRVSSSVNRRCRTARSSATATASRSIGLARKSYAPERIAPIAAGRLPNAVSTITGRPGRLPTMRSVSASPSRPAMCRSVITTSTSSVSSRASASAAELAVTTSKPRRGRPRANSAISSGSSSTINARAVMAPAGIPRTGCRRPASTRRSPSRRDLRRCRGPPTAPARCPGRRPWW